MNYLAHAYLSFGDPDILVGNMISDFIKGKKKFDYPPKVQNGIMLHRKIDEYTDHHPATRDAKQFLKAAAGIYAGSFMDIVYDHFLANDSHEFEEGALAVFAGKTYDQLDAYKDLLPDKFDRFLHHMRTQNWLLNYRSLEGIRRSFEGLTHRAKYIQDAEPPYLAFVTHYEALKNCYELFFPNVKTFAYNELLYLRPEN
ncbi:MAG: ACP phosphodiesterase [Bacteroidota bacterium]|nr:ACP phosphodiesterase [Bacteroidota bacterium]MDP4212899.1 ACP phosphodiesterase [Bacteroidota bacterium]MDP4249897.1 ACP phosphodiesterase [Bacteroidota bacterium]